MAFDDVQFPETISKGSTFGPGFSTAILQSADGAVEERISRWQSGRCVYDAKYGVKSDDDLAELVAFYRARAGALRSFRFKDFVDCKSPQMGSFLAAVAFTDQTIGTGDGVTTTFQLVKRYTSGSITHVRTITKPRSGTVVIGINGVNQPSGWSVNTTTGIVTFTSAPGAGLPVTAGYEFDVEVRFGSELDLNIPVTIEGYDSGSVPSIPLVEVLDSSAADDEFWYGGAKAHGAVSASFSITVADGRIHTFAPTTGGLILTLPNYTSLQPGGPYFVLVNQDATNSISVRDHLGNTIVTLSALNSVTLYLGLDGSGTKVWFAT